MADLAPLDRELFQYLSARPNEVCTFEELLAEVWGDPRASERGLQAAIYRLRQRIKETVGTNWNYIQNIRGKGYRYVPAPE